MLDLYVNVTLNFCCFLFNYETNVHYTDDSKLLGLQFIDLFLFWSVMNRYLNKYNTICIQDYFRPSPLANGFAQSLIHPVVVVLTEILFVT